MPNKNKTCRYPNFIFRLRKSRRYGQKTLARLVGLRDSKAISLYETGTRLPTLRTALTLEMVLGCRLEEMYPDLFRCLEDRAIAREAELPASFTRHIKARLRREEDHGGHP